jgi:hypothetical protein
MVAELLSLPDMKMEHAAHIEAHQAKAPAIACLVNFEPSTGDGAARKAA